MNAVRAGNSRWDRPGLYQQPNRLRSVSGGGDAAPAWSPTSKSGLLFWFDATQITGLVDNDPISTWDNSETTASRDATSSSTNRPLYKTNVQNGKPGVLFDGSNDYFAFGTDTLWDAATPFGIVIVAYLVAQGATPWYENIIAIKTGHGAKVFEVTEVKGDANRPGLSFGLSGDTVNSRFLVNCGEDKFTAAPSSLVVNYDGTGTTGTGNNLTSDYAAWLNNAAQTLAVNAGSSNATATNNFIASRGTATPPSLPMKNYLFEVFAYNSQITTQERTDIASYVSGKWNISQAAAFQMPEESSSRVWVKGVDLPKKPYWKPYLIAGGVAAAAALGAAAYFLL